MLSYGQALELIQFSCLLVWTSIHLVNGHALAQDDLQWLSLAGSRIQAVVAEAHA